MKRYTQWFLMFLIVATVLAGCGRRRPAATPTPPPPTATPQAQQQATTAPTTAAATATPQAQQQPTTAPTATTAPVTSGEPEATDPTQWTGLATINTYRSRYIVGYAGIQEGKEITQSIHVALDLNREQNASYAMTESLSSEPQAEGDSNRFEMIRIGDQRWMKSGESWGPLGSGAQGELDDLAPAIQKLFTDVTQLRRVGVETVNGVQATHYLFDLAMMSEEARADMGQLDTFDGHLYVATGDAPYVVKMQFAATGPAISLGQDKTLDGRVDMLYEVYDINQPITIEEPEVGPPSLEGFAEGELPLPADAEIETAGMDILIYNTAETITDTTTFYREQLTALGWTEQEGGLVTDTYVSMDFVKENITLSVGITTGEDNKTQVSMFTSTSDSGG